MVMLAYVCERTVERELIERTERGRGGGDSDLKFSTDSYNVHAA